jgi:hypothetical protein
MPLTASEVQKLVATEDDFGHEMRVGTAIRAIPAFEVKHGGTYIDRATSKPRQFDYRCTLTKPAVGLELQIPAQGFTGAEDWRHSNKATRLMLAVECKNLNPSFPLVIYGADRQVTEAFQDLVVSIGRCATLERGNGGGTPGPGSLIYRASGKQSFYDAGESVGKSLLRLKPENKGSAVPVAGSDADVYEKWAQAISSAIEMAERAQDCAQNGQLVWSAVLPIVVVSNESLWKVAYDADGKASQVQQVDHCEYYVGFGVPGMRGEFMFSHIHFLTLKGFSAFLSKMAVNQLAWETLFNPALLRFGPA